MTFLKRGKLGKSRIYSLTWVLISYFKQDYSFLRCEVFNCFTTRMTEGTLEVWNRFQNIQLTINPFVPHSSLLSQWCAKFLFGGELEVMLKHVGTLKKTEKRDHHMNYWHRSSRQKQPVRPKKSSVTPPLTQDTHTNYRGYISATFPSLSVATNKLYCSSILSLKFNMTSSRPSTASSWLVLFPESVCDLTTYLGQNSLHAKEQHKQRSRGNC